MWGMLTGHRECSKIIKESANASSALGAGSAEGPAIGSGVVIGMIDQDNVVDDHGAGSDP